MKRIVSGGVWLLVGLNFLSSLSASTKETDTRPISGDIVFQDTSVLAAAGTAPVTLQAGEAIKKLTNSQWSHCGIFFYRKHLGAVVVEGDGASGKL